MDDSTATFRPARVSESGRILTPEEAAYLQSCLLEAEPIVVVGTPRPAHAPSTSDAPLRPHETSAKKGGRR